MDCLLTAIYRITANVSCYRYLILNQGRFRNLASEAEEVNKGRKENYDLRGESCIFLWYFQVTC